MSDTPDLVSGVGGAFVCSNDPARLADWYERALGIRFEKAGPTTFYVAYVSLDPNDRSRKLDTTLSIMRAKVPLPERTPPATEPDDMYGDQPFMLNVRVWDLDRVCTRCEAMGVRIIKREDTDYGRFAWVRDADGSRVELYEPLEPTAAQ
jgi:catechol 2,3-dioxygenase-like lactoylglutathione lyase family enzyme